MTGLIPPLIWLWIIISGSVGTIFSKYLMSDAENTQRNKELEADIKKLYPTIGYIKVNGVYQGSK